MGSPLGLVVLSYTVFACWNGSISGWVELCRVIKLKITQKVGAAHFYAIHQPLTNFYFSCEKIYLVGWILAWWIHFSPDSATAINHQKLASIFGVGALQSIKFLILCSFLCFLTNSNLTNSYFSCETIYLVGWILAGWIYFSRKSATAFNHQEPASILVSAHCRVSNSCKHRPPNLHLRQFGAVGERLLIGRSYYNGHAIASLGRQFNNLYVGRNIDQ